MSAIASTLGGPDGREWRKTGARPWQQPSVATGERSAGARWRHDGAVSTRTLIALAAICAVAILAASAIQILLAR
jgi:hypothetical protein